MGFAVVQRKIIVRIEVNDFPAIVNEVVKPNFSLKRCEIDELDEPGFFFDAELQVILKFFQLDGVVVAS